jgi:toxin-antitoxin system PIN domain toxin
VSYTLDANVLLYASDDASPLHGPAFEVIERVARGPEIVYLFWPTIMTYLRIATHPAVFARPFSNDEATGNIEQLLSRPHVRSTGEQDRFWRLYRDVAQDAVPAGNLVSDAHIVALMLENDVRTIWTRDRDFRRFRGIKVHDPFENAAELAREILPPY